jgi:5'-3' exonuclease
MGVPRFFRWVVKKYPNTFIKGKLDKSCSYLCYDINGLLHPCVRQSISEKGTFNMEDVEKKVREKMFEVCKITNPKKGILICIDGVAPLAKMYQQRYRRYKSVYDKQLERELYAKHGETYPFDWDTNAITPSTDFMKQMDILFGTISKELEAKYPSCTIYYSPSSNVGEGEHKIMEILRGIPNNEEDSYFIHGLDADLIFLSMGLGKENIYLMREQGESVGFLNVSQLKNKLFTEIQSRCKHRLSQKDVEKDFMVLSYFLGNDFLPAIFSLHIDQNDEIIKIYCDVVDKEKRSLVNGTFIDWNVFCRICEQFSQSEYVLLKNKVKKFLSSREDDQEHTTRLQKDIFWARQRPKEDALCLLEGGWKERFYRHYFHFDMNSWNEKNAMMLNYLEGLQWNLTYYLKGVQNWQWNYRYHAAPFFADMFHFISKRGVGGIIQACRQVAAPARPPNNIEQLLVVLPPQSSNLIPMPYRELMTNYKVSNIIDIYPVGFNLDFYYKQKDWEYKPILPDIDFSRIQKEIARVDNKKL